MSLVDSPKIRRAIAAMHKSMVGLDVRDALLMMQGAVASIIVDNYTLPQSRDEAVKEHCQHVENTVHSIVEERAKRRESDG